MEIIGLVGVARDITERKRVEVERAEMQKLLRQSQKMEAVGQLTGGVAHDLNNLLAPIIGFSEMLVELLESENTRQQYAQHILDAAERAKTLVQKLLAFSRKQTLEFRALDLNELIREFEPFIKLTVRENVTFVFEAGNRLAKVHADKGQLEQVLMNLVVNEKLFPG